MRSNWLTGWALAGAVVVAAVLLVVAAPARTAPRLEVGGAMAGPGFYQVERWGLVKSTAVNPDGAAASPLVSIHQAGRANTQFAQRLWLPPRSQRRVTHPFMPRAAPSGERGPGIKVRTRLIDDRDEEERALGEPTKGQLIHRPAPLQTASLRPVEAPGASLLGVLREAQQMGESGSYLRPNTAPDRLLGWAALEALMISRPDPSLNAAQMQALRQWLVRGGRLWLRLDKIKPGFARKLIGEAWTLTRLDRVSLSRFTLKGPGGEHSLRRDYPVPMVRVAAPNMETVHTAGGYPASLRMAVGEGTVVATTLGRDAWIDDEGKARPPLGALRGMVAPPESPPEAPPEATPASRLGSTSEPADPAGLAQLARQQVGHQILGRTPVALALGGLVGLMMAGGLTLYWRDRLEHLAWVGGGLAVVAAGVVLSLGLTRQAATPTTVATAAVVKAAPGTGHANIRAVTGVYGAGEAKVVGDAALPGAAVSDQVGSLTRLVWRDRRQWRYQHLPLPGGEVTLLRFEDTRPLSGEVAARVRFTAEGLVGEVNAGAFKPLTDPVVATPTGWAPATRQAEGRFLAQPGEAPARPRQFFAGGVLGQRQQARRRVLGKLLPRRRFPAQPVLLGWSNRPLDMVGLTDAPARRRDTALVRLPLTIQPPEPGRSLHIPACFLPIQRFDAPGVPASTAYDARRNMWVPDLTQPMTLVMRFKVPEPLKPLSLNRATVLLGLDIAGRSRALVTWRDGGIVTLKKGLSAGDSQVVLSGENLPARTDNGDVLVGLRVGGRAEPGPGSGWTIHRLQLTLDATAGE